MPRMGDMLVLASATTWTLAAYLRSAQDAVISVHGLATESNLFWARLDVCCWLFPLVISDFFPVTGILVVESLLAGNSSHPQNIDSFEGIPDLVTRESYVIGNPHPQGFSSPLSINSDYSTTFPIQLLRLGFPSTLNTHAVWNSIGCYTQVVKSDTLLHTISVQVHGNIFSACTCTVPEFCSQN